MTGRRLMDFKNPLAFSVGLSAKIRLPGSSP